MISKKLWLFSFLLVLVLLIAGQIVHAQRNGAAKSAWEYKITGPLGEQQLNELGAQGWEMIAATAEGSNYRYYLKRAK